VSDTGSTGKISDVDSMVDGTERAVGTRPLAVAGGVEARTVVLRRAYDTTVEDLWDACTDPRRLARWFLPVTGDLRVGGRFSIKGNASGDVVRCEPPRLLGLTWEYGEHPSSEVEVRLAPAPGGGATLEIEHGFPDPSFLFGVGVGWEPALVALEAYTRRELPDNLAEQWQAGEPPAEFMARIERSSALWAGHLAAAGIAVDGPPQV
jgi:uncharacterized protein YndB with AHSA1/START domain